MKKPHRRIAALCGFFALIVLAQSCALSGSRRIEIPCDESFEAFLAPVSSGEGVEIVGRLRLDLPRYRLRGLMRVVHSPREGAARIDFRHSSLFGAIEEEITILAGDSLVIYDRESGDRLGNDSSLALVREEMGADIAPDDILVALLFAFPRCADMRSASVERAGGTWLLRANWRNRRIEVRGEEGRGHQEFRQCFPDAGCYTITYGEPLSGADFAYPRWIRLRAESGSGKASFEVIELKSVTCDASSFEMGAAWIQ